jgi:hypothetical protein
MVPQTQESFPDEVLFVYAPLYILLESPLFQVLSLGELALQGYSITDHPVPGGVETAPRASG